MSSLDGVEVCGWIGDHLLDVVGVHPRLDGETAQLIRVADVRRLDQYASISRSWKGSCRPCSRASSVMRSASFVFGTMSGRLYSNPAAAKRSGSGSRSPKP